MAACAPATNSPNGIPKGKLVWPNVTTASDAEHKIGVYPNKENLAKVKPGMTRNQIYALLGTPQYPTAWRSTEWTYLFYTDKDNSSTGKVNSCLYKILFDHHFIAKNFYTKPLSSDDKCPETPTNSN